MSFLHYGYTLPCTVQENWTFALILESKQPINCDISNKKISRNSQDFLNIIRIAWKKIFFDLSFWKGLSYFQVYSYEESLWGCKLLVTTNQSPFHPDKNLEVGLKEMKNWIATSDTGPCFRKFSDLHDNSWLLGAYHKLNPFTLQCRKMVRHTLKILQMLQDF